MTTWHFYRPCRTNTFFNDKQNKAVLKWLLDAIGTPEPPKPVKPQKNEADRAIKQDISRLEDENWKLQAQIAKLKELSSAVMTIKTFKMPKAAVEPKAKETSADEQANNVEEVKKDKKKKKPAENNPDVKPVLEKMRALGKQLKADGKSEEDIKEHLAPLKDELKDIKAKFKEEKIKAKEEKAAEETAES